MTLPVALSLSLSLSAPSYSHSNMYWIDWLDETGTALIEKASMDGKGRQVIVDTDLGRPYDLTLDLESSKLYFIDGYRDTITSTDLDGSNRQQLHLFLTNVVPFSLVFHNGVLYWTERRMRLISKLTVNEETRQLGNVSVMSVRPAGLVMIAADRQPECELEIPPSALSLSLSLFFLLFVYSRPLYVSLYSTFLPSFSLPSLLLSISLFCIFVLFISLSLTLSLSCSVLLSLPSYPSPNVHLSVNCAINISGLNA